MLPRLLLLTCLASCAGSTLDGSDPEFEQEPDEYATLEQGLVTCDFRPNTGYRAGTPFALTLVTADGQPIEVNTANAYAVMQAAAASQGVQIRVNDGFRSPEQQQYFYSCYVNCNCNSCNLAARPGYSNHQSGTALDLNTSVTAVYNWLSANGAAYGFHRTVPSERWHWEYMGGGPGGGPCVQSCDRVSGPFAFSCDGPQANMTCVNVNEPSDPHTWTDNFFCSARDLGLRWSFNGDLPGMDCTPVTEAAELYSSAWSDNRLCVPPQSPWSFDYSSAGPIAGKSCVHWNEPGDPHSWGDNYVCSTAVYEFSAGGFTFTQNGPRTGKTCVNVNEPSDPDTWSDNYFCSATDLGMQWSYAGPIAGMDCTNVAESAESQAAAWADNFLCLPAGQPWRFTWSSAGPIAGKTCVRWFEHSDTSATWMDNWLCIEERTVGTPVAPAPAPDPRPAPLEEPAAEVPPQIVTPDEPAVAMHLQSMGCSTGAAQLAMFAAVAWLLRRRRTSK
ncbi:MAG: M15 family metallopeptidase [Archangium sp.]|nr:M15 family metallopeptidase [Archangium sp.]